MRATMFLRLKTIATIAIYTCNSFIEFTPGLAKKK